MELYPVGERFFDEFTLRQVLLNAARSGSGPSAAGISSPVEGLRTAGPAATTASLCRGEPEADGRLCSYREHVLITHQKHEPRDVVLACQGELRLAPSWHVVGIDIHAALRIAAARGCDLAVLSEALPQPRRVWSMRCLRQGQRIEV
jgi:hypothetical protein